MSMPWPALLVAVWESSHDNGWLGAAGAARLVPYIALSWWAGRLADRFARGRMVRLSLIGRVGALLATSTCLATDHVGAAVAFGCLTVALGTPAYPAIAAELPRLAGPRSDAATGLLVTFEVAAFFAGPALGGLALGWGHQVVGCWIATALTAVALVLVRGVPWCPHSADVQGDDPVAGQGVVSLLLTHRAALRAVVVLALNNLVGGAVAIALLPLALSAWRGGSSDFGTATTALGLGALAAPILLGWWGLGQLSGRRSSAVLGAVLVVTAAAPDLVWALVPLGLAGATAVHIEAVATRAIQVAAPERSRSSVLGLADSVMVAAAAIGAAVTPWLAGVLGARGVVALCALVGLGIISLLSDAAEVAAQPDAASATRQSVLLG